MLERLDHQPCRVILIFDKGYFSEFGTLSITEWIGRTQALRAKNFGLPESAFDDFPRDEVYFTRGSVSPEAVPPNLRGKESDAAGDAQVPAARPGATSPAASGSGATRATTG
jgi:oxalate decarboxylase